MDIEMPDSTRLKVAGIAIIIGRFISGCALEKRFETPEEARISTDVRGSLAQQPDLRPPGFIQTITTKYVSRLPGLVSSGLGDQETEEIKRAALGIKRVASNAAAINDPADPPTSAIVGPVASTDAG
jgi:hypothetical protein